MHRFGTLTALAVASKWCGVRAEAAASDRNVVQHIGRPEAEVRLMMEHIWLRMCPEGYKHVTEENVKDWVTEVYVSSNVRHARGEMRQMDKDHDARLSWPEVKSAMDQAEGIDHEDSGRKDKKETDNDIMLRKRFDLADLDHDGHLTDVEFTYLLSPGLLPQLATLEAEDILKAQDRDGDGKISFEEFAAHELEHAEADKEELKAEFALYNVNNDEYIDKDEILAAFEEPRRNMLHEAVQDFFKGKDKITKEEFMEDCLRLARSALTDHAQLLRYPQEYPLKTPIPFTNLEKDEDEPEVDDMAEERGEEEDDVHEEL